MSAIFVNELGWTLLHFLWQGSVLAAATALAMLVLRNASAEQRYSVACVALLLCIAWPAYDLAQRLGSVEAVQARFASQGLAASKSLGWRLGLSLQESMGWIVALWGAIAASLALRMLAGLAWLRSLEKRTQHAAAKVWQARTTAVAQAFRIARPVRLHVLDDIQSPVTAGWWRPVVLLPAALVSGMPPDLLEALLAHELAHIRRHDYLVNLLQNLIETLLFYHPGVWWISKRIRAERELIADRIAAQHLGEPRRLALALSALEKCQFGHQQLTPAANGGDLLQRVQHLMRPQAAHTNWLAALPSLVLAAACLSACSAMASAKHEPVVVRALADFSSCKKPRWPVNDLKQEHTGTVTLQFTIAADGSVTGSRIAQSSGYRDLDTAARLGISKCTFKPETHDGVPVPATMRMQYVWTLI